MFRNLMLTTFGTLAVMLVIGYYSADPKSLETPRSGQVIDLFDRIAFSGYGDGGPLGQGPMLRRWSEPVQIAIVGAPAQQEEGSVRWSDAVKALADVYDALPGLAVSVVADVPYTTTLPENSSLAIVTVPAEEADEIAAKLPPDEARALTSREVGCAVIGDRAAVLARVTILLRDNLGGSRRTACLGETMAKALGFTIDSKVFSDTFRVRDNQLTFHPLGRMAAALVYDPALQAGMSRQRALALATDVLKDKGIH